MRRREKGREGRLMQGHDCGERTDTMTNACWLIVLPGSKVVDPPHDYALIKSGTGRHVP